MPNNDEQALDEIREGVKAALAVSLNKLQRLGYSPADAEALLLEMVREVLRRPQ